MNFGQNVEPVKGFQSRLNVAVAVHLKMAADAIMEQRQGSPEQIETQRAMVLRGLFGMLRDDLGLPVAELAQPARNQE